MLNEFKKSPEMSGFVLMVASEEKQCCHLLSEGLNNGSYFQARLNITALPVTTDGSSFISSTLSAPAVLWAELLWLIIILTDNCFFFFLLFFISTDKNHSHIN